MKNRVFKYSLILWLGLVVCTHQACDDDLEKELAMRSFFKVHQGNEDDIYFLDEPIQFYNYSLHSTSYLWDFGDGSVPSTEKEPVHTFTNEGKFAVSLIVSNGVKEVGYTDSLTIVVNPD